MDYEHWRNNLGYFLNTAKLQEKQRIYTMSSTTCMQNVLHGPKLTHTILLNTNQSAPGAPLTFLKTERGVWVTFLGLKFWPKVIYWVTKKKQREFLGMLKKVVFFWVDKFWSCDFFGYKTWTSAPPPPPPPPPSPLSLKFVSGTPGQAVKSQNDVNVCNVQAVFCNCISCVFTQIMMSRIHH